ncbi:MAG: serine/threonine protein kinase [Firmicutes bacterium]|nr:serine/threonine protein kinase [Bacillota bacterium]
MQVVSTIVVDKIRQIGVGQGRNSEVFLANDPQLNGMIALKEIPLKDFDNPGEYFREAQNLYTNKHPYIVPVMYACQDADKIRIVMPHYKNGSVQDILNRGSLTVRQIIKWSHEFLLGLHHVHSNGDGYVHYDIKPSNLLIQDDGSVMLADFGQMRPTDNLGVAQNPPLYPWHFPPEAFRYTGATKQADIYQVGLTLYRMCNGNNFFDAQKPRDMHELRQKVLDGTFPNRNKFLPHIPRRLKTIIKNALHIDPSMRYQTTMDLIEDLGQIDLTLYDWIYVELNNVTRWFTKHGNHEYVIEILNYGKEYYVEGKTIRLPDRLERKRSPWCSGPYSTYNKAINAVLRVFRELEG